MALSEIPVLTSFDVPVLASPEVPIMATLLPLRRFQMLLIFTLDVNIPSTEDAIIVFTEVVDNQPL